MEIIRHLILIQSLVILNKCLYDKGALYVSDLFFLILRMYHTI